MNYFEVRNLRTTEKQTSVSTAIFSCVMQRSRSSGLIQKFYNSEGTAEAHAPFHTQEAGRILELQTT